MPPSASLSKMFLFQDDIFLPSDVGGRECLPGAAPAAEVAAMLLPSIGKGKLHSPDPRQLIHAKEPSRDHRQKHRQDECWTRFGRVLERTSVGCAKGENQPRAHDPAETIPPELPCLVPAPPLSAPTDSLKRSVITSEAKPNATSSSWYSSQSSLPEAKPNATSSSWYSGQSSLPGERASGKHHGGHRVVAPPKSATDRGALPSSSPMAKRQLLTDGADVFVGKSGLPTQGYGLHTCEKQHVVIRRGETEEEEEAETHRLFEAACERRRRWKETAATGRLKAQKIQEMKELDAQSNKSPKLRSSARNRAQNTHEGTWSDDQKEANLSLNPFVTDNFKFDSIKPDSGTGSEPISMMAALITGNGNGSAQSATDRYRSRKAKSLIQPQHHAIPVDLGRISQRDKKPQTVADNPSTRHTQAPSGSGLRHTQAPQTHSTNRISESGKSTRKSMAMATTGQRRDYQRDSTLRRLRNSILHKCTHKDSLNKRIKRLRKLRKNGFQNINADAQPAEMLSEEDKEFLSEVFSLYDADESGQLDMTELKEALCDLGLQPRTREEKLGLGQVLLEVDREGDAEIDREEFEDLVVKVMLMIREVQRTELFEHFSEADVAGTGSVKPEDAYEILHNLGLDPRTDAEKSLLHAITNEVDEDKSGSIEFSEFESLIVKSREQLSKMRRRRQREVCKEENIDEHTKEKFKGKLLELKDAFDAYDDDKSGHLDRREIGMLIADCGLTMRSANDREQVNEIINEMDVDGDGNIAFKEFLHLVTTLRKFSRDKNIADLKDIFQQYDKDGSESLSLAECSRMLEQMKLTPKTREEQRQIAILLEEVDEDGSGELDFNEFAQLYQHVSEKLASLNRKAELAVAKNMNLSRSKVEEYSQAFATLDPQGVGELGMDSVRRMMDLLRINISGDALYEKFCEVDEDESGVLEFSEFLVLMKSVETWVQQKHSSYHQQRNMSKLEAS